MPRPTIVCVTPIKNEEWILERFLRCAGLWADHIVLADQQSTDASRIIAARHPKAEVIDNPGRSYDEASRQRLLIDAARRHPGPRLIVAIDADEFFSARILDEAVRAEMLSFPPGTVLRSSRIDLAPDPARYQFDSLADGQYTVPIAFMDDGSPHTAREMHSPRVPQPEGGKQVVLDRLPLLHYQFCSPERMESKHRWYRCLERVKYPGKSLVAVHRYYDWMRRVPLTRRPTAPEWFAGYEARGIDMKTIPPADECWWDWEVLRMFAAHGTEPFAGLDIWDPDWESLRQKGLARGIEGMPTTPVVPPKGRRKAFALGALKRTARLPLPVRMVTDKLLDWLVV